MDFIVRKENWLHALILVAVLAPYFVFLGESSLWDANEAFYAETPREMREAGNYVIPLFNYTFRWQKPPLAYWGVCLSYACFGVSEWSERLPIALAACAWILLAYVVGRHWFSSRTGLTAALFLALNFRVFIMSRRAITEIWLAFFLSLALVLAAKALWGEKRPSLIWMTAAWAALALAVLTKGPVALILFAGILFGCLLLAKKPVLQAAALCAPGAILLAVLLFPWYYRVIDWVGLSPVRSFLLSDNLGRFLTEDFGPLRGPFYYVGVFLSDFAPWAELGLAVLIFQFSRNREMYGRGCEVPYRPFLLFWFLAVFLFFSFSRNKQEYYILPLYFPAALLFAEAWNAKTIDSRWCAPVCRLLFVFIALAAISVLPVARQAMPELLAAAGITGRDFLQWQTVLAAVAVLLAVFTWRRMWTSALVTVLVFLWGCQLAVALWILPAWEQNKPVRAMSYEIQRRAQPEDAVGYYRVAFPSLCFYLQRPIEELIDERHFIQVILRSPNRKFFLLQEEDYTKLQPVLEKAGFYVVRKQNLWRWKLQDYWGKNQDKNSNTILLIAGPAEKGDNRR